MSLTVTDDVGKPVESADGETPGSVAADAERAPLDPEPDMTDRSRPCSTGNPRPVTSSRFEDDAIDEVTDDTVRLRAAFSAASVAPDDESEPEPEPELEG